jgi:hypothetical protein
MEPQFTPAELRKTRLLEYLLRFVFGGAVALAASAVGETAGPRLGGLFLAFPALLPAGLTLVKRHDGRQAAADDARGAVLGSVGLAAFALVVWWTAGALAPWLVLTLALTTWVVVSVVSWRWLLAKRSG